MRTASPAAIGTWSAPEAPLAWSDIDASIVMARSATVLSSTPRPFIRWAGSKQRLLTQLVEHLPSGYARYYEPFFGAGSMFFMLQPERATLNDFCLPLVDMYRTVQEDAEGVLEALAPMDVLDEVFFYSMRKKSPENAIDQASRFIYLNRAAWNGLYRVNKRGEFNVPYGRPKSSTIIDPANLLAASSLLARPDISITHGDFSASLATAGRDDLVFLDPPYASSKKRDGFIDYNEKLFTWDDQVRLAETAEALRVKGAHVIVTNAYNTAIQDLYPNFRHHGLIRRSSLASDVSRRGPVAESVFVS